MWCDSREGAQAAAHRGRLNVAQQVGFPDWVEVNDKEFRGVFKQVPARDDILPDINENLVVELYSK
jgi:small subunit ribosomal protein S4